MISHTSTWNLTKIYLIKPRYSHLKINKTKGTLVPGREQLDMIYDSVCLHCVVLDSIYLNFVCLILFSLIESALIVSALIVSTLIVSTLIVSNLVVSALIMSALTFQQFKYLKKAY